MPAPLVYLQTQNDHGSWVTPTFGRKASRLEYRLSHDTLAQLKASPANARLVCCATGRVLATKHTVMQARAMIGRLLDTPAPPAPRPVIRAKNPDGFAPVVIPEPKPFIRSWWASTVTPGNTHMTGQMLVATQDCRFVPPKKRVPNK